MYKIYFYVPIEHAEAVKNAMFEAGAGKVGHYTHCCWQVLGQGQFMPLDGSNPFIGKPNEFEQTPELKVEMICHADDIKQVMDAFLKAHPYETPAYGVIRLENMQI